MFAFHLEFLTFCLSKGVAFKGPGGLPARGACSEFELRHVCFPMDFLTFGWSQGVAF